MIVNRAFVLRRQSLPALPLTVVHPKVSYLTSISLTGLKYDMGIRTSTISQVVVFTITCEVRCCVGGP